MKTGRDAPGVEGAAKLSDWLLHAGSFMQRLKQHGIMDAKVKVLAEGWQFPLRDERQLLGIPARRAAWVRVVSIASGDAIWMYARTVIPQSTLKGKERQLKHLKTRALGTILFKEPTFVRSEFEIETIHPKTPWHEKIARYLSMPEETLWARRSIFALRNKPGLLKEVFFPAISHL